MARDVDYYPMELWNFTFDREVNDFAIARNGVNVSVVVENPNGEMLYFTNYGSAYLYPVVLKNFKAVALSPNGRYSSVDAFDGTLYFYDNSYPDKAPKYFVPPYQHPPQYDVDLIGYNCQAVNTGGYWGVFDGSDFPVYSWLTVGNNKLNGGSVVSIADVTSPDDVWDGSYVMFATEKALILYKNTISLFGSLGYEKVLNLSFNSGNLKDADLAEGTTKLAITTDTQLLIYNTTGDTTPYWTYTYPSVVVGESVSISDDGKYAVVLYNNSGTYGSMLFNVSTKTLIWSSTDFAGIYINGDGTLIGGFKDGHPALSDVYGNILWSDLNITIVQPSKSVLKMNNEGLLIVKDKINHITAIKGEQYSVSLKVPDAMVPGSNYTLLWNITGGTAPYKIDLYLMGTHRPFLIFNHTTVKNASFWYNSYFFYWINRWYRNSYQQIISTDYVDEYNFALPPPPPGIPPYSPFAWGIGQNWTTAYSEHYPAWTWGQIPPPPYAGELSDWYVFIVVRDANGNYAYGKSNIMKVGNVTSDLKMSVQMKTVVHSGDYLKINVHVDYKGAPAPNVTVFPIFPTPLFPDIIPSNFTESIYYGIIYDGKTIWPKTDENGNLTLWYNLPILNKTEEKIIFLVALRVPENNSAWPQGAFNITRITILPPDISKPYRALILDPLKNPIIFSALERAGKNNNEYWDALRSNFTDLEFTRIDPWSFSDGVKKYIHESPKTLQDAINVTHANVIVLSDTNLKIWELNNLKQYKALKTFLNGTGPYRGGLVLTHGSVNDVGIAISNKLIGSTHYTGLYKDNGSYKVDFNDSLAFEIGIGLIPILEKIKLITGSLAYSVVYYAMCTATGHQSTSKSIAYTVSSVINNTPLLLPYVPFNGTIKILNESSTILNGITTNGEFTLNITSPLPNDNRSIPYTVIGWQLEYPELIALEALNLTEKIINYTANNTSNFSYYYFISLKQFKSTIRYILNITHQNANVLNKILPFNFSLFNEENRTNMYKLVINSIEFAKKVLYSIYQARLELPNITVYIPPFKVYYPNVTGNNNWTLENVTLGNTTFKFTLPREIAEVVCKFLKPPEIVAVSKDYRAAILQYEGIYHRAVWFTFKPESTSNYTNLKLMYNAIRYASVIPTPPQTIRDMIVNYTTYASYLAYEKATEIYENITGNKSYFVPMNGSVSLNFTVEEGTTSISIGIFHPYFGECIKAIAISPSNEEYYSYHYNLSIERILVNNPETGVWQLIIEYNTTLLNNSPINFYLNNTNYEFVVVEIKSTNQVIPEFTDFVEFIPLFVVISLSYKAIQYKKRYKQRT